MANIQIQINNHVTHRTWRARVVFDVYCPPPSFTNPYVQENLSRIIRPSNMSSQSSRSSSSDSESPEVTRDETFKLDVEKGVKVPRGKCKSHASFTARTDLAVSFSNIAPDGALQIFRRHWSFLLADLQCVHPRFLERSNFAGLGGVAQWASD